MNGLLVPVGDKDKLIQAIEHIVSMDMEERRRISMAAKDKMTKCYTKQIIADEWEALFSQLIHS